MVQSGTYIAHPAAFLDQPFAAPHQSAGSEVPSDSFPPGEAKGEVAGAGTIQFTYLFREQRGAKSPYHLQIGYSCNRPAVPPDNDATGIIPIR